MSEFQRVRTKEELDLLDVDEIVQGYRDAAVVEPGSDKSRSYWHGWRNSMVDRGLLPIDDAQIELARSVWCTDSR